MVTLFKRCVVWKILCLISCATASNLLQKANILIFGGNGFLGSECANHLLKEGHSLTLVNRGSNYFDYDVRIKPYITHIKCDRYEGLDRCKDFKYKMKKFDIIIDFSAYEPKVIEDALKKLNGSFQTFIYISSDSVYEVCQPQAKVKSEESDAIRFTSKSQQKSANEQDMYGHLKLVGEEILMREHVQSNFSYLIFRLPDVIGPRDNTNRWWSYQAWFQFFSSSGKPLLLPKSVQSTFSSFVYVKDVAKAITRAVADIMKGNTNFLNNSFNLGFEEILSLRKLLDSMQKILNIQGVEYRYDDQAYYGWPSVYRGPVDISKAKHILQWKPSPWIEVINETTKFYKEALLAFPEETLRMMNKLAEIVGDDDVPELVSRIESVLIKENKLTDKHTEL